MSEVSWESEEYVADVGGEPTDDRPLWEGVVGAGEHRTVGPHRAYCLVEGEWCYPDLLCRCCGEHRGDALLTAEDMRAIRALIAAAREAASGVADHGVWCSHSDLDAALEHPAIKRLAEEGL